MENLKINRVFGILPIAFLALGVLCGSPARPEPSDSKEKTVDLTPQLPKGGGRLPFLNQRDIDELARKGMPGKKPDEDSVTLDTDEFNISLHVTNKVNVSLSDIGVRFICQDCTFIFPHFLQAGDSATSVLADINRSPRRITFPVGIQEQPPFLAKDPDKAVNIAARDLFLMFLPQRKEQDAEEFKSYLAENCIKDPCQLEIINSIVYAKEGNKLNLQKIVANSMLLKSITSKEVLYFRFDAKPPTDLFRGNTELLQVLNSDNMKKAQEAEKMVKNMESPSDFLKVVTEALNPILRDANIPLGKLSSLMKEGKELLKAKKYSDALEKFKEHLEISHSFNAASKGLTIPQSEYQSRTMIGHTFNQMGDYAAGLPYMEKGIADMKTDNASGLNNLTANELRIELGTAYMNLGRNQEAQAMYEKTLSASVYLTDKDFDRNDSPLGRAGRYRAALLEKIGQTQVRQKNFDAAATSYLKARKELWSSIVPALTTLSPIEANYQLEISAGGDSKIYPLVFKNETIDATIGLEESLLSNRLHFEMSRFDNFKLPPILPEDLRVLADSRLETRHRISRLALLVNSNRHRGLSEKEQDDLSGKIRDSAGHLRRIEKEIHQKTGSRQKHAVLQHMTSTDVLSGLRPDEATIEYITYKDYDYNQDKSVGDNRYGALILSGRTKQVRAVDLGKTDMIDKKIAEYREAVVHTAINRDEGSLRTLGLEVRHSILDPILGADLVKDIRRIYIVPSGQLTLLSFESLPSGKGKEYLVEEYELVYLMTTRDLPFFREFVASTSSGIVWLLDDPDFDSRPENRPRKQRTEAGGKIEQIRIVQDPGFDEVVPAYKEYSNVTQAIPAHWKRLQQTHESVARLGEVLADAGIESRHLTGPEASEETVLHIASPQSMILATHGYFAAHERGRTGSMTVYLPREGGIGMGISAEEDPLHDSMLVLAGTNDRNHRHLDDGLLTAYEIWGMDLRNTEFVALIGCETGLGKKHTESGLGRDISGLQEAFFVAGARSLIMSTWEVPVNATMAQFDDFVRTAYGGTTNRYQAFHAAQLQALKRARDTKKSSHPIWWAGFVYFGDPGDLPRPDSKTAQ